MHFHILAKLDAYISRFEILSVPNDCLKDFRAKSTKQKANDASSLKVGLSSGRSRLLKKLLLV